MSEPPNRHYPPQPVVGVGVVVRRGEEVLLVRRGRPPRQGSWGLPGGAQQLGETVFDAARREVMEETGLTVEPVAVLDVVDSITHDDRGRIEYHYTLIEVLAEWLAGAAEARDDAAAVAWARLDDLERFALWSETARIIGLAVERGGA